MKRNPRKQWFVRQKNYLAKGMGEGSALRYLTYLIGITGVLSNSIPFEWIIMLGIGYIAASYAIGLVWDKMKLYQEENEFNNDRNYFVQEMRAMERRIREDVKKAG